MRRIAAGVLVFAVFIAMPSSADAGASAHHSASAHHTTWIVAYQSSAGDWRSPGVPGALWYTTARPSNALAVPIFTSIESLRHAIAHHRLGRARTVAFDPEKWDRTPSSEQRHPIMAMRAFTALARRHHLGSIVAPGRDLPLAAGAGCAKFRGETLDQAFLACGLSFGAVGATYLVLQAAPEESTQATFIDLLHEVRQQLRFASRRTHLLVTLSTAKLALGPLATLTRRALAYATGVEINTTSAGLSEAQHLIAEVQA